MNLATYDTECERLVADLLGYMTPAEKAGQLAMCPAPTLEDREATDTIVDDIREGRVGCVHGIVDREQADYFQKVARDESRLGIPLLFPARTGQGLDTILPSPLAASASWDTDSVEAAEAIVAQEAATRGINWSLSPKLALSSPAASTPPSSAGEDIHLAATMAVARIRGLQGDAAKSEARLLASLDLSGLVQRADEAVADPVLLLRFACAAATSGKVAAMNIERLSAGNRGVVADALRVLNAPGGFDGIMLTQWQDIADALAEEDCDAATEGVPCQALVTALERGTINEALIDEAVGRVLRAKFRHGLLRAALAAPALRPSRALPTPVHNREAALSLARRCPVLTRNDPALLPLGIDSGDVLLVGPAASDRHAPMPGGDDLAASVIDGLEQLGIPHRYVPGLALRDNGNPLGGMIAADPMAIGMASEAAKRAGTVILVLNNDDTGALGEAQEQLLGALVNANPRLVVVNIGPCPLDPWFSGRPLASVLHAGRLGLMSGHAIAELLAGEFAPCGKLPVAIPATSRHEGLPFGHGLNYADFALTNLAIEHGRDRLHAFVDLRNVAEREGTEVVQLYLRRPGESEDAARELVDFQRLSLRGGQVETLVFDIGREELGRHSSDGSFRVDEGRIEIFVGLSSRRGMTIELDISAELARAIAHTGIHPAVPGETGSQRRRA